MLLKKKTIIEKISLMKMNYWGKKKENELLEKHIYENELLGKNHMVKQSILWKNVSLHVRKYSANIPKYDNIQNLIRIVQTEYSVWVFRIWHFLIKACGICWHYSGLYTEHSE